MSLFLDVQFLNEISYRLDKFSRKGAYIWNCRCMFCGDSQKNKNKTRGYFYKRDNRLSFKCHNCGKSTPFSKVLEMLDPVTYSRYRKESFGQHTNREFAKETKRPTANINQTKIEEQFPFLEAVINLPRNHEARQYIESRSIPVRFHSLFYYVAKSSMLCGLAEKYSGKFKSDEPRVVLPFYNEGRLLGITARDITGRAKQKYIACKLIEDEATDMIFGLDRLDRSKHCLVVEGPIDSLFLTNAVAVGSASLDKVLRHLPKEAFTMVFDNQPRNKDVVRIISGAVEEGCNVFFWPDEVEEKDINELISNGATREAVEEMIHDRTFQGLTAKAKFNQWRKV